MKLVSTSKRSVNSELQDYDSNPNDYIAAEIPKSNDDKTFTIGDGKDYNGFYNAPLEKEKEYEMLIGVGSKIGEVSYCLRSFYCVVKSIGSTCLNNDDSPRFKDESLQVRN